MDDAHLWRHGDLLVIAMAFDASVKTFFGQLSSTASHVPSKKTKKQLTDPSLSRICGW